MGRGAQIRGAVRGAIRGARGICAECVRVRAAESVGEYPSDVVGYWIRYGPRDTRDDRARHRPPLAAPAGSSFSPSIDAPRPTSRPVLHLPFNRPLQTAAVEWVGHNSLQRISYGMGFYSVGMHFDAPKPEAGGGGGRVGPGADDVDA